MAEDGAQSRQRVVVLGGGPAGDVAALRASQIGADVVMVERAHLGGTCLNWGCIPTKALLAVSDLLRKVQRGEEFGLKIPTVEIDFPAMMARKDKVVKTMRDGVTFAAERRKVKVARGQGRVEGREVVVAGEGGEERYPYDHLILCTGSEPAQLPGFDFEHPTVLTSNDVVSLTTLPKSMIVLGAGVIGCEFASLFAPMGVELTMVELLPRILAGVDDRTQKQFQQNLKKQGVTLHLGKRIENVKEYRDDGITVVLDDGTELSAECLLVSIGRQAQTRGIGLEELGVEIDERGFIVVDEFLRTSVPNVWGAGDCIGGLQLAHLGSAEGARAVENALEGKLIPMDRTVVPSCVYTHPEIATVGLHADAAKEAGHQVLTGMAKFGGDGKALGEGEPEGYVQLVADKETRALLGATIYGGHATELIHDVGSALYDGMTIDELGDIIHAHPTFSEMIGDAALAAGGRAPYLS
jgi:dihydrolipoamide dehydrogenase